MHPDLVIVNARIRTLDPARPAASAVAARDGTIVAVGAADEVRAAVGGGAEVVDLRGAALVPGLVDSHQHPFYGTLQARGADLTGLTRLDDIRDALRRERRRCGDGDWVRGYALAYEAFTDTGVHGHLIEDAVEGSPAFVTFFDLHTALATPRALALAGVDGPRAFAEEAEVVCAGGRPTGELREMPAYALVEDAIPRPSAEERLGWFRETFRQMNACGLTGAHVMLGEPALFDTCRELEARGWLTLRFVVPLHQEPGVTDEAIEAQLQLRGERGRLWRAGSAKFFIDGVVEPGTAWLHEPDANGRGTAPFWPDPARYAEVVRRFAAAGFQCITHAVGDRAVTSALDAYRAAGAARGVRHRIEHIETLRDVDLPRFAAEGVVASMQPLHMENMHANRSDPWSRALGTARCDRAFRTRDLADSGALVTLGSDWAVARYDPRRGMGWARLRREPGHPERGAYLAGQALTAAETLAGYTTAPALTVSEADVSGRIAPGFRADLTAFAEDPVETPADDLLELPVVLTVVDGLVVARS
jgi:hypothetical protein